VVGVALDLREAGPHTRVPAAPADPAPEPPPARGPARHRRPRDLAELADRAWRPPLAVAVALFAACGPVHALGYVDAVYYAVLIGLALSGLAVPLGLLGLRHSGPDEESAGDG
jgi:hypothetical protein